MIAMLGLDTPPAAPPKIVPHRGPTPPAGFLPTQVASLYGFDGANASEQCIAIIELDGGYTEADNEAAFRAMGLAVPEIVAVAVDGGANNPDDQSGANDEVALDIQVAGGVAPGARIAIYFAPNTSQGFEQTFKPKAACCQPRVLYDHLAEAAVRVRQRRQYQRQDMRPTKKQTVAYWEEEPSSGMTWNGALLPKRLVLADHVDAQSAYDL